MILRANDLGEEGTIRYGTGLRKQAGGGGRPV